MGPVVLTTEVDLPSSWSSSPVSPNIEEFLSPCGSTSTMPSGANNWELDATPIGRKRKLNFNSSVNSPYIGDEMGNLIVNVA